MFCLDHEYSEIQSSDKEFHNLDQKTQDHNKVNEEKDDKTEQKTVQESGHYWWCPTFTHLPNCHYVNIGFQDPNYWSPGMANQYSMPYIQVVNNCDRSLKSTPSNRRPNTGKRSPKTVMDDTEIERLYSCRLCDQMKEIQDVTALRKHIEAHLGKMRPFICRVCDKVFKFRSNCRNHIIAHSVVRKNIRRVSASVPIHPSN